MGFVDELFLSLEEHREAKNEFLDNIPYYALEETIDLHTYHERRAKIRGADEFQKFKLLVEENKERFDQLVERLSDEQSREYLREVLLFRLLGPYRFKMSTQTTKLRDIYERAKENRLPHIKRFKVDLRHVMKLYEYHFPFMKVVTHDAFFMEVILLKQYHLQTKDVLISVEKDDVVLDCGSEFGDTGLLFAHRAGKNGQVYCFECSERNRLYFRENLARNFRYKNIELLPYAVFDKSGEEVSFSWEAGATRIDRSRMDKVIETAETIALDDFCSQKGLDKLDFIKMDVEGAEKYALEGARQTIQRFKPKLAIAAYHQPDDFLTLSELILDIEPSYKLFLRHHSIHASETVLYAVSEAS